MIGRLLIWEEWAVGLTNSVAFGVGYWDDGGDWHAYGDSFSEHEWRPMLWSLVRLSERAQAHTKVPALLTHRGTTNVDGRGGGLADLQLGFRYEVVQIGEYLELPSLALTTSVLAPTGRSMDQAQALWIVVRVARNSK